MDNIQQFSFTAVEVSAAGNGVAEGREWFE